MEDGVGKGSGLALVVAGLGRPLWGDACLPPQEKMEFRSASIRLFGHLNKACHGDCEDVFVEQVVGGLAPLLLHLQDPQAPVASVSSQWEMGKPWGLRDSAPRD